LSMERQGKMANYQYCTVTDEGRIRIVTLNRPDVMNALHSDAHDELETVWDEFAASDDLWLAIITGALLLRSSLPAKASGSQLIDADGDPSLLNALID